MNEVTDADRGKAVAVLASARADEMWRTNNPSDLVTRIASALAEEREKARAPFLALADEAEACAKEQKPTPGTLTAGVAIGMRTVASSIRRTADLTATREETP